MEVAEYLDSVAYVKDCELEGIAPKPAYFSKFDDSLITFVGLEGNSLIKFLVKHQITEELTHSTGYSPKEKKWYGWSHRAAYGFSIGDVVKEGDCTAESGWTDEYLAEHPEDDLSLPVGFIARTKEDTKRMAIAFAESVS
jgi:hypothetical protein